MRGIAREYGRAQLLQNLRQFNSPKEGYTQFVVIGPQQVERLSRLEGKRREYALDEAIVKAVQARLPVDLLAMERWVKDHGWYIGLSGKNQVLKGKIRLTGLHVPVQPEIYEPVLAELERLGIVCVEREEPVGRRLDFLMQELNREANTLGSKSVAAGTTNISVELKVLIEQLREQIQNVE